MKTNALLRYFVLPIFFAAGIHCMASVSATDFISAETIQPVGRTDLFSVQRRSGLGPAGDLSGYRIEVQREAVRPFDVAIGGGSAFAVERGDVGQVVFWARTLQSPDETGQGHFRVVVRDRANSWPRIVLNQFSADREWREFSVPFQFNQAYPAGEILGLLEFGFGAQILDVAGVRFIQHGKSVDVADLPRARTRYAGDEPDARWRKEALERIERIRTGDLVVEVVSVDGAPVDGAEVTVRMVNSQFDFGTCFRASRIMGETADDEIYRRKMTQLFNAGSPENELKWPYWRDGVYDNNQTLAALRWMKDEGLRTRGHVLVWPSWRMMPRGLAALQGTPEEHRIVDEVMDHIRDMLTITDGLLVEWDVINEPYNHHDLMDTFGRGILVDIWKQAERYAPEIPLYLNDWGNHDQVADADHVAHFEETARFLIENGARVDGLGLQAHMGGLPTPPERVLETLDRYQRNLGLDVRITEFDVNTEDEEMQGAYTRDFLIAMYSHPSVVGVQIWGFWEGQIYVPRKALYRRDWSEKPNGAAWRELVTETWRTRGGGTVGDDGRWQIRGHFGEYRVEVRQGDRVTVLSIDHSAENAGRPHGITLEK